MGAGVQHEVGGILSVSVWVLASILTVAPLGVFPLALSRCSRRRDSAGLCPGPWGDLQVTPKSHLQRPDRSFALSSSLPLLLRPSARWLGLEGSCLGRGRERPT